MIDFIKKTNSQKKKERKRKRKRKKKKKEEEKKKPGIKRDITITTGKRRTKSIFTFAMFFPIFWEKFFFSNPPCSFFELFKKSLICFLSGKREREEKEERGKR